MQWRGLHINTRSRLSLRNAQLCIESSEAQTLTVPLEDVAFLVLESRQATLTSAILAECAEKGCLVLFCDEKHMPSGALLPFSAFHRQLESCQAQIKLTLPKQKRLWQSIICRKIRNQAHCLKYYQGDLAVTERIGALESKVRSGDPDNCEAIAARLYWPALTPDFHRDSDGGDRLNAMLNYTYILVRSLVAREIAALGFVPCLGIHHCNLQNAFNLADDLMEPWRPLADKYVLSLWYNSDSEEFTKEDRQALLKVFFEQVELDNGERQTMLDGIRAYLSRIRAWYVGKASEIILPLITMA